MLTILADVQITSRKRVHLIVDVGDQVAAAAPTLEAALDYLVEQGECTAILQAGAVHLLLLDLKQLPDAYRRNRQKTDEPVL